MCRATRCRGRPGGRRDGASGGTCGSRARPGRRRAEADREEAEGERAAGLRHVAGRARDESPTAPRREHDDQHALEHEQRVDALRPVMVAARRARGSRRRASSVAPPVNMPRPPSKPKMNAGGRKAVECEQRGHDGEGGADEDGARVVERAPTIVSATAAAVAGMRAEPDGAEVDAASGHCLVPADDEQNRRGKGDSGRANSHCGRCLPPQHRAHGTLYRPEWAVEFTVKHGLDGKRVFSIDTRFGWVRDLSRRFNIRGRGKKRCRLDPLGWSLP